jgi:hypothetical protein
MSAQRLAHLGSAICLQTAVNQKRKTAAAFATAVLEFFNAQ